MADVVLNLGADKAVEKSFVAKATDPVITPTYSTPADFSAQYPQPLDTTELITMCEEVTLWRHLPEHNTQLMGETWRELNELAFTSGSSYIAFTDGACPEEYKHDGDNTTVNCKNIGAKKNLSIREIQHSLAVAGMGAGINALNGPFPTAEGFPGTDGSTLTLQRIMGLKEKEVALASVLVLDGWDELLVNGNASDNSLEFDGVENWATNQSCTMHTNDNSASGTFSAASFDRFLAEGCAQPNELWGHPQAIQEVLAAYFQLGFAGSQLVNFADGNRITPGYNFSGFVNTGSGLKAVVADSNFTKTAAGSATFQSAIWAMRTKHNGEDIIYKLTQIPFGLHDLTPGCTAISFMVWAATCLIIKACCAQGKYTSQFSGRASVTTCTSVG